MTGEVLHLGFDREERTFYEEKTVGTFVSLHKIYFVLSLIFAFVSVLSGFSALFLYRWND